MAGWICAVQRNHISCAVLFVEVVLIVVFVEAVVRARVSQRSPQYVEVRSPTHEHDAEKPLPHLHAYRSRRTKISRNFHSPGLAWEFSCLPDRFPRGEGDYNDQRSDPTSREASGVFVGESHTQAGYSMDRTALS